MYLEYNLSRHMDRSKNNSLFEADFGNWELRGIVCVWRLCVCVVYVGFLF